MNIDKNKVINEDKEINLWCRRIPNNLFRSSTQKYSSQPHVRGLCY